MIQQVSVQMNEGEKLASGECSDLDTTWLGAGRLTPREDTVALLSAEQSANQAATDESTLLAQARQEPAAFGVLYERYIDRVYAYIYHRVGNVQDTEDLTARTFYRALDKLDTYEDRGLPFSAWLFRIAHNLVANWHRDRGRRRFLSLDRLWSHSQEGDSPEEKLEQAEKHEALWAAISRLPADRKELLLYKFANRLSNLEIGQLMNKSEGAIKSLYFRTLASLRKDLESKGWSGLFVDEGESTPSNVVPSQLHSAKGSENDAMG